MKFNLCLTKKLAKTKSLLQTGNCYKLEWSQIVDYFMNQFNSNISPDKDTFGFTIGQYKEHTFYEWRIKLYKKFMNIEESLSKMDQDSSKYQRKLRVWQMLNTEEKRMNILSEIFFESTDYRTGFHRISNDVISKQSVIIDFDNTMELKIGNKIINHNINLINSEEIMEILNLMSCSYLAYSSYNNRLKNMKQEKFRVVIPVDRPYLKSENYLIKEAICNIISVRKYNDLIYGLIDITSFEPSRFFYVPVNHPDNQNKWFKAITDKPFLSVDDLLKYHKNQTTLGKMKQWNYVTKTRKSL